MKNAPLLHAVEYGAFLAVKGALRSLPHAWARRAGQGLGTVAYHLLGRRRRKTLDNLALAFPELDAAARQRVLRDCFRHLGLAFCDALSAGRFDAVEFCRRLTLEGWDHLHEAEGYGRGVFVMSAHLGCWEAAAHPVGLYRGQFDVVGRPLDNPHLNRELMHLRTRFGNGTIDKQGAARGMLKVLRQGGRVGILIDQRPRPGEGIEVPFFGRPSRTTDVLARLSLRTGAPVVPIFGYPEAGGTYRVVLRPPILPPEAGDDPEAVTALTARYLDVVEAEIRRQPELWLWLHDRWKR